MKPRKLIEAILEKKGGKGGKSLDANGTPRHPDSNVYYATLPSRSAPGGFVYYQPSKSKDKQLMCGWLGTKQARDYLEAAIKDTPGGRGVEEVNPFLLYTIRKTDGSGRFMDQTWKPKTVCAKKPVQPKRK